MSNRGEAGHRFDAASYRLAEMIPSGHLLAATDPAGFLDRVDGWRIGWKDTLSLMALARAECEDKKPFWLWFAALQFCAEHECEEAPECPCAETEKCITEYCAPCAAQTFLAKMPGNPWSQGQVENE